MAKGRQPPLAICFCRAKCSSLNLLFCSRNHLDGTSHEVSIWP